MIHRTANVANLYDIFIHDSYRKETETAFYKACSIIVKKYSSVFKIRIAELSLGYFHAEAISCLTGAKSQHGFANTWIM